MRTIFLSCVLALAGAASAVSPPADAQTAVCPPGYYYASDGQCYPGPPPVYPLYPPPVYEVAPPVYPPPVVFDGLGIGLGFGAVIGGRGHRGGGHFGGRGHR